MLTRFVRNQLIIFTIASIVGVAVMVFTYMQVPTLLGLGKINVKLELPASGGRLVIVHWHVRDKHNVGSVDPRACKG